MKRDKVEEIIWGWIKSTNTDVKYLAKKIVESTTQPTQSAEEFLKGKNNVTDETLIAGSTVKIWLDEYATQQKEVSDEEIKKSLRQQKEEIRQWLIDEDFEGLAERL